MLKELTAGNNINKNHIFKILPLDEPLFEINSDSRDIIVPEVFRKNGVGVQGDQLAETLFFSIDRYFEMTDLFREDIQGIVQWESAAKGKQFETGYSYIVFKDVTIVKDKMVFGWLLNDVITSNPGTVKFSIRFFSTAKEFDAAGNEVLKLDFSLSTKTQTVTINPAISYDINDETGLPEVNAYNDLHLVVNRFKNSVYTGEADSAEDPIFVYEGGINYPEALFVKNLTETNAEGEENVIHVVDLGEDGKLTLTSKATSTDAGKISYFWFTKSLKENSNVEPFNDGPDKVYVKTTDFVVDKNKTYYTKTDINGSIGFTEVKLTPGNSFPEGEFYEEVNGIEVINTGNYWVEVQNRHGVASSSINSEIIRVPAPGNLTYSASPNEGNFLNSSGYIKLKAVGTTDQIDDTISYVWTNGTTTLKDDVSEENKGFSDDGSLKNSGDSYIIEEIPVEEFPYYDEEIQVTITASRNKADTKPIVHTMRVTADPHPIVVTPLDDEPETSLGKEVIIGVNTSLKINGVDRNIVSDNISYQWFKYTSSTEDEDFFIEGANQPTYTVPGDIGGRFYCRVTNTVNGKSVSINSALIKVNRD